MAAKKTLAVKRQDRRAAEAKLPSTKIGGDRIDKFIAFANQKLGGEGSVHRGSEIEAEQHERRLTGIPTLDYLTNGGWKKGGAHEIGGAFSAGKTTIVIQSIAYNQRVAPHEAVCWIALEPFSKRWARENGFFIPFDEENGDPFADATETELHRMQEACIEDPYAEISPFVLVQEERGDAALNVAALAVASNEFAFVIVDSLGIARSSKWLEEQDVEDFSDFPREPKMIGDYTARVNLMFNRRYDENNQRVKAGIGAKNQTTVININQITTVIGSQAYAEHKKFSLKGGEANKHNHHCIIFVWKGQEKRPEKKIEGQPGGIFGIEVNAICIKSKIGPPFRTASYDFYFNGHENFWPGEIDTVKDLVNLALLPAAGKDHVDDLITRQGAWFTVVGAEEFGGRVQGRTQLEQWVRDNPEWYSYLRECVALRHRR